jgi:hypothetical protein
MAGQIIKGQLAGDWRAENGQTGSSVGRATSRRNVEENGRDKPHDEPKAGLSWLPKPPRNDVVHRDILTRDAKTT